MVGWLVGGQWWWDGGCGGRSGVGDVDGDGGGSCGSGGLFDGWLRWTDACIH